MTVQNVLDRVYELRPELYDDAGLLQKLLGLENMILTEIHFTHPLEDIGYGTHLVVSSPYDDIYEQYLLAQIDRNDMEIEQYNQDMQLFNGTYQEYAARYRRDNLPKQGPQVKNYA